MARKLVCICNLVEEKEIETLLEKGANSTEDIQKLLRAGTSCGCRRLMRSLKPIKRKNPKTSKKS